MWNIIVGILGFLMSATVIGFLTGQIELKPALIIIVIVSIVSFLLWFFFKPKENNPVISIIDKEVILKKGSSIFASPVTVFAEKRDKWILYAKTVVNDYTFTGPSYDKLPPFPSITHMTGYGQIQKKEFVFKDNKTGEDYIANLDVVV